MQNSKNTNLKIIREYKNLSQEEMAHSLGLSVNGYINYEKGKRTPPSDILAKITQMWGVNGHWLLTCEGEMLLNTSPQYDKVTDDNEFIIVERIGISKNNDINHFIHNETELMPILLGKKLIENILKVSNVNNIKVFRAKGDSMESTIYNNDDLLVDISFKDFNNGGVFVLAINNDYFIKRLRLKINGDIDIISDNKDKYPIETKRPNDNININIIGRVIKNLSRGL